MRNIFTLLMAAFLCFSAFADGGTNDFKAKALWIESGLFFMITPVTPIGNPDGCTNNDGIIILKSHPSYKEMVSTAMLAKAQNLTLRAWVTGCYTFWGGNSWPVVHAIGAE